MLKSLYIKNYALIDSLEIDFGPGFSVITGETGAGKSIILGALGLILGQRADVKALKQGENKCIIEGSFDVSAYDLKAFCEERDIEFDAHSYILRREILASGKSRAFINDTPVSLTDLKELGGQLIDIHSQHQNLLLGDDRFQMQVVDIMAANSNLLKSYQQTFRQYRHAEKVFADLQDAVQKSKEEEDYLRFQYDTLSEAALSDGEQEELEAELETLTHAEDIKSGLYKIHLVLSGDEHGVVAALKESLNTSQALTKLFAKAQEVAQRIESSYIDLKDLASEVERLAGDVEFNPQRLSEIESRLDLIYTLQKKYRLDNIAALLLFYKELEAKIGDIDSSEEQIEKQRAEVERLRNEVFAQAVKLSDNRQKAVGKIEKELISKVAYLGMPNVRFECNLSRKSEPDAMGVDDLVFLFSANKNAPLQPVADVASGGEISRLMLCLKSMIAGATALPTIIFDEIDTGVSGEIADKMGIIMQEFGAKMQVIAITHLPQIAARGRAHYHVYKTDGADSTVTNLRQLSDAERLDEVARMLSGAKVTDAAIENAKVMLGL